MIDELTAMPQASGIASTYRKDKPLIAKPLSQFNRTQHWQIFITVCVLLNQTDYNAWLDDPFDITKSLLNPYAQPIEKYSINPKIGCMKKHMRNNPTRIY